ncbi:MAG: U32 family peptidase [Alphaproteobacteria bacterium]|nr:U32 family peptidase [Alphaproteobacteria bacterium]
MTTELLAPAGDLQSAYAALYWGADAIYLGLKSFSARATATNFDENELDEICAYAHHLGKKVYVAINTVVLQNELHELVKNLDVCAKCRVDAVILQDLGVAHLIKTQYAELEMHASTQMAVHNAHGAKYLKNLGFSRVVLARELNLQQINEIASIEGLETEVFIHGALCFSYSGLCQFSALEHGKSANRGKCLYPCRAYFEQNGRKFHPFSMKDLALEGDISKIKAISLKIEGRKKSALYVAAVTDYYRQILDGKKPNTFKADNIRQIFSRPWCKFLFEGKTKDVVDPDFVGHRGLEVGKIENVKNGFLTITPSHIVSRYDGLQIDVNGLQKPFGFSVQNLFQKGKKVLHAEPFVQTKIELAKPYPKLEKGFTVYLASSSEVKGAYDFEKPKPKEFRNKIPVSVSACVFKDHLTAQSGDTIFSLNGRFEAAENADKVYDAFYKSFHKTGDTPFELDNLKVENPKNLFVPASIINELRRGLYESIKPCFKKGVPSPLPTPLKNLKTGWIIKIDNLDLTNLLDLSKFEEIIYLIDEAPDLKALENLPKEKLRICLPAVCENPEKFEKIISTLTSSGYKKWEVSNYWGLEMLDTSSLDVSFSPFLYMANSQAMLQAKDMGASRVCFCVEDTLDNIKALSSLSFLKTSLIVYQDAPLFTSAVCIRKNSCATCNKKPLWISLQKDGKTYRALCKNCKTMLFSETPLSIASIAKEVNASYYQMDFCYRPYTPEDVLQISNRLMRFEDTQKTTTCNLLKQNI